jgi:CRISPR-associated endonuclease/helicase Cas3
MAYYAHTVPGRTEAAWELLADHLAEVAQAAGRLGGHFGAADLAACAGLLHDLGKYGPDFQARLRDPSRRADHSSAGAVWATNHLPRKWGALLAHVVAGHHAGLKDDLLGQTGRIQNKQDVLHAVERAALEDGLVLPAQVSGPAGMKWHKARPGFQSAFLTRMIFSCLIDADREAAAAFDARARGVAAVHPAYPTITELEAALQADIARRGVKPGMLNAHRDTVLRAAMAKAADTQGVFTLTVPTGGGKTLTSLAFALAHARAHGLDRVIVVIPFTSIIEQTAQVYRQALGPALEGAVLEHHSAFEMTDESAWSSKRVGPDRLRLAMERWDSPIVVTTAVQFFESLFSNRPSRCRKLHSLARSVVVLDEAQTMPLPLLRPCVAALKELALNYRTTVVLCTATQPALAQGSEAGQGFEGGFQAPREIAPDVPALFAALRRVTLRDIGVQDDPALAARIAAQPRALCIVNQRAHARALFEAISHLPGARHLSTCMHSVHRARVLAEIRDDLDHERPCRVIATSLVEAGVDVDFPMVLRASAGLDQIAQAAGRCNREFRFAPDESEVLVFKPAAYDVIRQLRRNAEAGAEMLLLHGADPFGPTAMRDFFQQLYWRYGKEELDRGGVLRMCADRAGDMNFPFEQIANAMRFVEDTMVPVIVPKDVVRLAEVEALVEELRYAQGVGRIARKLQPYTVGVPRPVRNEMVAKGVAEDIRREDFGDQFVVLRNLDIYDLEVGLTWDDILFMDANSTIVS